MSGQSGPNNTRTTGKQNRQQDDDRPGIWVGYGKLLKLFRERAGLTQEALAHRIGYSVEQVGSVEQGRRPAKSEFTQAVEGILDADGALQVLQSEVDFAKLPPFFRDFALIELEAVSHHSYEPLLVPGLLQTEAYARTLFQRQCPPMGPEVIDENVEARLNRQTLLTKTPPVELSFIIGEAALRNPAGSRETMKEQLCHLLECAKLDNVEIQVMSGSAGYHPGLSGPFVMLETAEFQRYGYVESQGVGTVVGDPARVSTFGLRYGKLRSQAADAEKSAILIKQLAEVT